MPLLPQRGRVAELERQLADEREAHALELRRSRDSANQWRDLTRSKVSQLEAKAAELEETKKQLKAARRSFAKVKPRFKPAVAPDGASAPLPETHIPPENYTPSESPLVAANVRFVEDHLAHRWLQFAESDDARSHNELILDAAEEHGLRVRDIGPISYFFDQDGRCRGGVQAIKTSLSGVMVGQTAASKEVLKVLLHEADIPTPAWAVFASTDKEQALEYVRGRRGTPLVLKPMDGRQGTGVTTGVTDVALFGHAWDRASKSFKSGRVMIEEEVAGVDVRVFVVAGKAVGATVRIPPFVIGDGESTLTVLIGRLVAARRRHAYSADLDFLPDPDYLARTGVYHSTVLPSGAVQFLNGTANLSQGGVSVDVTDTLPTEALRMAEAAAGQVPGLRVGGVDLLMPSVESAERAVVLEMNAWANIRPHVHPAFGEPRNVATSVVAEMLKQTQKNAPTLD